MTDRERYIQEEEEQWWWDRMATRVPYNPSAVVYLREDEIEALTALVQRGIAHSLDQGRPYDREALHRAMESLRHAESLRAGDSEVPF